MAKKKIKPKRGRPKEGRIPFICHVMPKTADIIDGMVDQDNPEMNSRGRVVESKFNSVN